MYVCVRTRASERASERVIRLSARRESARPSALLPALSALSELRSLLRFALISRGVSLPLPGARRVARAVFQAVSVVLSVGWSGLLVRGAAPLVTLSLGRWGSPLSASYAGRLPRSPSAVSVLLGVGIGRASPTPFGRLAPTDGVSVSPTRGVSVPESRSLCLSDWSRRLAPAR